MSQFKKKIPEEVIAAFINDLPGTAEKIKTDVQVHPVDGGLINHSFKITLNHHPDILLQQINKAVFKNPEIIQDNYIKIWQYLTEKSAGITIPSPLYAGENPFYIDQQNHFWRAFEYVDNVVMVPVTGNPVQIEATARAFGKLTAALNHFDAVSLQMVIPFFHDLSFRYQQFKESVQTALSDREKEGIELIQQLREREHYTVLYEKIKQSPDFPLRVMHHDAKTSNVLFDADGHVICLVDLDTMMPGYFFSDLGDMIRSMAGNTNENDTDFSYIRIIPENYEAIIRGYLVEMKPILTAEEKRLIHTSGLLIIFMQALRFLTDYLNGDIYYRTDYPEHNLNRAKNQLTLLQQLENFVEKNYSFNH